MVLSKKHRQLIQDKGEKFRTPVEEAYKFISTNLKGGLLKDLWPGKDETVDDKLRSSIFDVVSVYIRVYENL